MRSVSDDEYEEGKEVARRLLESFRQQGVEPTVAIIAMCRCVATLHAARGREYGHQLMRLAIEAMEYEFNEACDILDRARH